MLEPEVLLPPLRISKISLPQLLSNYSGGWEANIDSSRHRLGDVLCVRTEAHSGEHQSRVFAQPEYLLFRPRVDAVAGGVSRVAGHDEEVIPRDADYRTAVVGVSGGRSVERCFAVEVGGNKRIKGMLARTASCVDTGSIGWRCKERHFDGMLIWRMDLEGCSLLIDARMFARN